MFNLFFSSITKSKKINQNLTNCHFNLKAFWMTAITLRLPNKQACSGKAGGLRHLHFPLEKYAHARGIVVTFFN